MPKANQKLVESLFAARGDDQLRYLISRLPNGEEAYLRLLRCNRDELFRHPEAAHHGPENPRAGGPNPLLP